MKKYKLIKIYPGSCNLGTEVGIENGNSKILRSSGWSSLPCVYDIENNPEFWKEIIEIPEYVECIINDAGIKIGNIYKVRSCEDWPSKSSDGCEKIYRFEVVGGPYYTSYFKPSTKEDYNYQQLKR